MALQPARPVNVLIEVPAAGQQRCQVVRFAADHQPISPFQAGLGVHVDQEASPGAGREVSQHRHPVMRGNLGNGSTLKRRTRDEDLGHLAPAIRTFIDAKSSHGLAGEGAESEQRRRQDRRAQGVDIVDSLAQAAE